jgi:predicted nucleic acid-binding protein
VKPEDVPDGPLLVDTDVVSYWVLHQQGHEFSKIVAGHELALSFASYGELLAAAHQNRWGPRRIGDLRRRLRSFVVVPYNVDVIERWAEMHAKLSGHLHKQGTNDLWTAACAVAMTPQLPVVTNNLRDFKTISAAFPQVRIIHPDL